MIVAIHDAQGKKILVVTDKELVGKKYIEGRLQLDFTSEFYKGKEMAEEEIKRLMRGAYIIHLAGKKSVQLGIDEGFVDEMNVKQIKGISHAEVLL
ncbi:MAG TPA: DUF424 family protein [Candidatus Nanoarchaeia archaeon]|nr:DUF424 family protein [Candidatus Nanoarchaeia archaeon]